MAHVKINLIIFFFGTLLISTNDSQAFDLASFVDSIKSVISNITSEIISEGQEAAANFESEWNKVTENLGAGWDQLTDDVSDKVASVWGQLAEMFLQYANKSDFSKILDEFPEGALEEYNAGLLLEDKDLNFTQLATKYGYDVETHEVETSDGYILTMFKFPSNPGGPPVLLMHGLISNADDFLTVGPDSALPYLLANQGYEVWLGNVRGTKHSRKHITMSQESDEFWDFSWDEMGRYDLPAIVDYVLQITNQKKLTYIAHSLGATILYVMCSELPEYNDKIASASLLSPVAYIYNIKSLPYWAVSQITYDDNSLGRKLLGPHLLKNGELVSFVKKLVCGDGTSTLRDVICANLGFMFFGFDNAQLNYTTLPSIISHLLTSASTKEVEHYAQGVVKNTFKKFDYGALKNLELYGSVIPPDYAVEKINFPMYIYYSDADWLGTTADIKNFVNHLSQPAEMIKVDFEKFSHLDFYFAKDVKKLVYDIVLNLIVKHL